MASRHPGDVLNLLLYILPLPPRISVVLAQNVPASVVPGAPDDQQVDGQGHQVADHQG